MNNMKTIKEQYRSIETFSNRLEYLRATLVGKYVFKFVWSYYGATVIERTVKDISVSGNILFENDCGAVIIHESISNFFDKFHLSEKDAIEAHLEALQRSIDNYQGLIKRYQDMASKTHQEINNTKELL